jgi:hypothetical protein
MVANSKMNFNAVFLPSNTHQSLHYPIPENPIDVEILVIFVTHGNFGLMVVSMMFGFDC